MPTMMQTTQSKFCQCLSSRNMKKFFITLSYFIGILSSETAFAQTIFRTDVVGYSPSDNGGPWGDWSQIYYCPPGTWATAFAQRVEAPQGSGDDTGLNSVALYCSDRDGNQVGGEVTPNFGTWGSWASKGCDKGSYMTYFALKVEGNQGSGDDTSANAVNFWCSNNISIAASNDAPWGTMGLWKGGYPNAAICGIQLKIESNQGRGDDTALNDLRVYWCQR